MNMLLEFIDDDSANPALKTLDEYLKFINKYNKYHSSDTFDYTIKDINKDIFSYKNITFTDYYYCLINNIIIIKFNKQYIGYIKNNILYIIKQYYNDFIKNVDIKHNKDELIKSFHNVDKVVFNQHIDNQIQIFYYDELIKDSKLINTIRLKGKIFKIYEKDSDLFVTYDIYKVGAAQDEFGAILLFVAKEFRNYGLGNILLKMYTEKFPYKDSGGITSYGRQAVINNWLNYVSEFLTHNKYIEYIKSNKLSKEKLIKILSDYKQYKLKTSTIRLPLILNDKNNDQNEILYGMDESSHSIVAYDRKILQYINNYGEYDDEEQLSNYIKGYMHFMETKNGSYLHKNYSENLHVENIMFKIALNNIDNILDHDNSDGPSSNLSNIKLVNNKYKFIYPEKTDHITEKEHKIRGKKDIYSIISIAEYKYQ